MNSKLLSRHVALDRLGATYQAMKEEKRRLFLLCMQEIHQKEREIPLHDHHRKSTHRRAIPVAQGACLVNLMPVAGYSFSGVGPPRFLALVGVRARTTGHYSSSTQVAKPFGTKRVGAIGTRSQRGNSDKGPQ